MHNKKLLIMSLLLLGLTSCIFRERLSHARQAEKYRAHRDYAEAIAEYEQHISARIAAPGKIPGENPYFYKLMIGDVYLESGDYKSAETSYIVAADHGVDKQLVASKLRVLAGKMAEQNKLDEAMDMLRKYHEFDPLMIDLEIDRLFKLTLPPQP